MDECSAGCGHTQDSLKMTKHKAKQQRKTSSLNAAHATMLSALTSTFGASALGMCSRAWVLLQAIVHALILSVRWRDLSSSELNVLTQFLYKIRMRLPFIHQGKVPRSIKSLDDFLLMLTRRGSMIALAERVHSHAKANALMLEAEVMYIASFNSMLIISIIDQVLTMVPDIRAGTADPHQYVVGIFRRIGTLYAMPKIDKITRAISILREARSLACQQAMTIDEIPKIEAVLDRIT